MIDMNEFLMTINNALDTVAILLEGGIVVLFNIIVSVLFVVLLIEGIKWLRRH